MDQIRPKVGIVVIGYNRTDSLSRLLKRLNTCDYLDDNVPLVISIDNCGNNRVFDIANQFLWKHGEKRVILYPKRMGLRKHVLKCGTYMTEFEWDAEIVLEDDVYPAEAFYNYSVQAVEKYQNDDRIAGIALFGLPRNQAANLPFMASLSKYDAFFVQLAQSCGQVWMRKQWKDFIDWYDNRSDPFVPCNEVPFNVRRWPETSWLKYHICYCVEKKKWFSYPYHSLTTNFSEIGSNTSAKSNILQTHLQNEAKPKYDFPDFTNDAVFYDAWCENLGLSKKLGIELTDLCIDLYGAKKNYQGKRYWLTTLSAPYKIIRSFGLNLMPMDMNVLCDLSGKQVFLYDTMISAKAPRIDDRDLQMWGFFNRIPYPDEMIWKLSRPMAKRIWMSRFKLVTHPGKLAKKIWSKIT